MNDAPLVKSRFLIGACVLLSACAMGSGAPADADVNGAYGAYLAARYADAKGDSAAASQFYGLALREDPDNAALVQPAFMAALLSGSNLAVALAPDMQGNSLAALLRGDAAVQAGDYAGAAQIYASLPPDQLTQLIQPILLAWCQAGQGDVQGALSRLRPLGADGPFGPVYTLNAALIADVAGDTKDAAPLYASLGGAQPDLRLAEILASWEARSGQPQAADAVLAQLMSAHPDLALAFPGLQAQIANKVVSTPAQGIAEAYLTIAGALGAPGHAQLQIAFLQLALQLRPDFSAARLLLAGAQDQAAPPATQPSTAQSELALATLKPIPPTDPLYGPAALQEADQLASLGRTDDAVAILKNLIQANPGDPDLPQIAGDTLREAGQFQPAITYYDQALADLGTPLPQAAWQLLFDRGICEDELGNWAAAEPDLVAARNLAPNQPYVLNYLAYSWALRGEHLAEARQMLTQAVSLDPNDGAVIDSLGYADLRAHQTGTALALLTQAVELDPDDAEVNAHLGDAFWAAGQKLQANYQWQRALALGPDAKLRAEITSELRADF